MRPSVHQYFMQMARLVSTRATCTRRQVGCVLVNCFNHVIATGYNGVPAKHKHCTEEPCPGSGLPSGEGLELCLAVHAEQNALLQCHDVGKVYVAYCTTLPCMTCTKLLLNTSASIIVFEELYAVTESAVLWRKAGRRLLRIDEEGNVEDYYDKRR